MTGQVKADWSYSREASAAAPRASMGWNSGSDESSTGVRAGAIGAATGRHRQTRHGRVWEGAPAGCVSGSGGGERGAELRGSTSSRQLPDLEKGWLARVYLGPSYEKRKLGRAFKILARVMGQIFFTD